MKNKSTPKGSVKRKGVSSFYNTVFFSKQVNGLSGRGARILLSGRMARTVNGIARAICYTSTRTFGCMIATFGLVSVLLHLGEYYFVDEPTVQLSTLIIGASLTLLALPLVLFDVPMCTALQKFPVTDYIFFEFFSIKRMHQNANVKGINPVVGAFIGIIPAFIASLLPIEYVLFGMIALVFVLVAFVSPEFPLLFFLIVLPYMSRIPYSNAVILSLAILTLLSFFRKVFLGKRVYVFGITDLLVLLLALVIILTGVIGGGSASTVNAWLVIALALIYIPTANIIVNRRLADCAANAIVFSAVPVAVMAIADYAVNLIMRNRTPSRSLAASPESLALVLTVALVFILFSMHEAHNSVNRTFRIIFSVIISFAIITTECLPVLLIFAVIAPAYSVIKHKKLPKELLVIFSALPPLVFLLPGTVLDFISKLIGMEPGLREIRWNIRQNLSLFLDNIFTGIGAHGFESGQTLPESNLLLAIGCRFGIVALAIFILILLVRLRQLSVYSRYLRHSQLVTHSHVTALAMFSFITLGWFCDLFTDVGIYCLFFVLLGMNTAAIRISKREHDDRYDYYRDQRALDTSNINILLR